MTGCRFKNIQSVKDLDWRIWHSGLRKRTAYINIISLLSGYRMSSSIGGDVITRTVLSRTRFLNRKFTKPHHDVLVGLIKEEKSIFAGCRKKSARQAEVFPVGSSAGPAKIFTPAFDAFGLLLLICCDATEPAPDLSARHARSGFCQLVGAWAFGAILCNTVCTQP